MARHVFWSLFNNLGYERHGIATIALEETIAMVCFRGGTVYNGYEIICYDDSVLAFLCGILRYDCLLYNFHSVAFDVYYLYFPFYDYHIGDEMNQVASV